MVTEVCDMIQCISIYLAAPLFLYGCNLQFSVKSLISEGCFSWKTKVATSAIESKKTQETRTALENYIYSAFNDVSDG